MSTRPTQKQVQILKNELMEIGKLSEAQNKAILDARDENDKLHSRLELAADLIDQAVSILDTTLNQVIR